VHDQKTTKVWEKYTSEVSPQKSQNVIVTLNQIIRYPGAMQQLVAIPDIINILPVAYRDIKHKCRNILEFIVLNWDNSLKIKGVQCLWKINIIALEENRNVACLNHILEMANYVHAPKKNGKWKLCVVSSDHDKYKNNFLSRAVKSGYFPLTTLLLRSTTHKQSILNQALIQAIRFNYTEIVKLLVSEGADIHTDTDSPLIEAASQGNMDIMTYLIEFGNNHGIPYDRKSFRRAKAKATFSAITARLKSLSDLNLYVNTSSAMIPPAVKYTDMMISLGMAIYQPKLSRQFGVVHDDYEFIDFSSIEFDCKLLLDFIIFNNNKSLEMSGAHCLWTIGAQYAFHNSFCLNDVLQAGDYFDSPKQHGKWKLCIAPSQKVSTNKVLVIAAASGLLDLASLSLNSGANVNAHHGQSLTLAAERGHDIMVKYLLKQNINIIKYSVGFPLFLWAIGRGNVEMMEELLSKDPSILQHSADDNHSMVRLARAMLPQHPEVMEFLIFKNVDLHSSKDSILIRAASYGLLKLIELLFDKYPDLLSKARTVLKGAIHKGKLEIVRLLASRIPDIHIEPHDSLFLAARHDRLDIVKFLIGHSEDEQRLYDQKTLCEAAKIAINPAVAEYLKTLCKFGIPKRIANWFSNLCQ